MTGRQAARCLGTMQMAWGGALLVDPTAVQRRLGIELASDSASLLVTRVLGTRGLLQGVLTTAVPTRGVASAGALVDALHALSMLALAAVSPRHRRAALVSAAAAGSATVGAAAVRRRLG